MKYEHFLKGKRFKLIVLLALIIVPGIYFTSSRKSPDSSQNGMQANKEVYSCPMHPSIVSDHPGKCPICHMDLQKVDGVLEPSGPETSVTATTKDRKILFYRHPMKPEITSPLPAKDEMGMDYVPVFDDEVKGNRESQVDGRAGFSLSQERQQLIGVTSTKATTKQLNLEIRASGKAAFDPELFTAIEEYRQAIFSHSQMKDSPYESLRIQANELVSSAKTKLRLMGLTDAQLRRLGSSETRPMNLILPKGNVWIYAEVFEYEVAGLKDGQVVEVTTPSVPGKLFSGKVTSISPILNAQSRTVRVRALVPDPDGLLRPDTYVNVKIKVDLGQKLSVPADAVLHSGEEDFVFVMKEQGRFEPRKVTLGARAQDLQEVASGLSEGETVVTSANFLIDSESRLRGVLMNMKSSPSEETKPGGAK